MEFRALQVHRHHRQGRGGGCVGIGSSGGKASDAYSHWRSVSQTATRIRLTSATPLCGLDRRNRGARPSAPSARTWARFLDVRHVVPDDLHEVERNLSLVATLGHALAPGDDGRLAVERPECDLPGGLQRPYVVVHPGASVPARAWSVDGHRGVVAALLAAGWHVAVTGGRAERDLTAAVAEGHESGVVDLGGRTTFAELATVLAAAEAVVVGNTGAAHLAVAVGTPVVSVYAPTVPASRWRPWRQPHVLLGDQSIACAGCRARQCPVVGHPCVAGVTPVDVLAAVDRLIVRRVVVPA